MLVSMFIFSAVDTQAKFLTTTIDPLQVAWHRQTGLLFGVIILIIWRGHHILQTTKFGLQIGRGICAALSTSLFIFGVSFVPLADAVALLLLHPCWLQLWERYCLVSMWAFIAGQRLF